MLSDKTSIPSLLGTALLAILSWQMLTLQNLTKSVEVLANQLKNDGRRIDVIEERLYRDYPRRIEGDEREE